MEDYILREINKIGLIIVALIEKLRLARSVSSENDAYEVVKSEMQTELKFNVEELIIKGERAEDIAKRHQFNDENLEKFAELLYEFQQSTDNIELKFLYIDTIKSIYRYLEGKGSLILYSSYVIKEVTINND